MWSIYKLDVSVCFCKYNLYRCFTGRNRNTENYTEFHSASVTVLSFIVSHGPVLTEVSCTVEVDRPSSSL